MSEQWRSPPLTRLPSNTSQSGHATGSKRRRTVPVLPLGMIRSAINSTRSTPPLAAVVPGPNSDRSHAAERSGKSDVKIAAVHDSGTRSAKLFAWAQAFSPGMRFTKMFRKLTKADEEEEDEEDEEEEADVALPLARLPALSSRTISPHGGSLPLCGAPSHTGLTISTSEQASATCDGAPCSFSSVRSRERHPETMTSSPCSDTAASIQPAAVFVFVFVFFPAAVPDNTHAVPLPFSPNTRAFTVAGFSRSSSPGTISTFRDDDMVADWGDWGGWAWRECMGSVEEKSKNKGEARLDGNTDGAARSRSDM